MSPTGPESALIVPVPEADPVVDGWRRHHYPSRAAGLPAHITILYPFLPPDVLTEEVIADSLFAGAAPFRFAPTSMGRFPGVTYLASEPADSFRRFTAAVETLWPDTPPYGGVHDPVVPHLTVSHAEDPDGIGDPTPTIEPLLPFVAECSEVWLMVSNGSSWTQRSRFPLPGSVR